MFQKKKLTVTKNGIRLISKHPVRRIDFDVEDREWLVNNEVKPDEYIDEGYFGSLYTVKGNPSFVVKVPRKGDGKCMKRGNCFRRYNL